MQGISLEFPDLKYQVMDLFSVLSLVSYAFGRAVKKQSNAPNIWLGTESGHCWEEVRVSISCLQCHKLPCCHYTNDLMLVAEPGVEPGRSGL